MIDPKQAKIQLCSMILNLVLFSLFSLDWSSVVKVCKVLPHLVKFAQALPGLANLANFCQVWSSLARKVGLVR